MERRDELELAVVGLLHTLDEKEVPLVDLVPEDRLEEVGGRDPAESVRLVLELSDPSDPVERLWLARLAVDVLRKGRGRVGGNAADALLQRVVSPVAAGREESAARALRSIVERLEPGAPLTQDVFDELQEAFGDALEIRGAASDVQVLLSGDAGALATLFLELATNDLSCASSIHQVEVEGELRDVIFVEVDVCTNKSFDSCKRSIDPTRWPDANPLFRSVDVLSVAATSGADWAGVIKERVGPGLNGKVYETNLSVTYLEREGMAITAFDLAPGPPAGGGKVTVDRGFLSLTEEGTHRRIRTLKVYRIEDLVTEPSWICPLWSSQLALAGWWDA
ncbi:MAG: hypothetical protein Q8K58_04045 [Acidimicrobiales bacterium]|nr:hypothetical protein [Acidimicrobiales bacterium]